MEDEEKGMIRFHAVMIGEDGMEFGADVKAEDKEKAHDELRDWYPESRIVQIESPEEAAEREARIYRQIQEEMDGDVPPGYYDERW